MLTWISPGINVQLVAGSKSLKVKRDIQAENKCLRIKEWAVSEATGIDEVAQEDLIKGEENWIRGTLTFKGRAEK